MRWIVAVAVLAGCAPSAMHSGVSPQAVAQEIAGRAPGASQTCVTTFPSENVRAIDAATLAVDRGPVLWVNRLRSVCPAVRPHNIVIIETRGSGFCSGDHVRGLEPGGIIPGPTCILGEWTPYRPI